MAIDTSQYENRYRKYLEDEDDVYQKPSVPLTEKIIMGGVAAVGLAATGSAMIKRGDFADVLHDTMLKAGQYRKGVVQAANRGVRAFSSDARLEDFGAGVKSTFKGEFNEAADKFSSFKEAIEDAVHTMKSPVREHQQRVIDSSASQLSNPDIDLRRRHYERKGVLRDLEKNHISANTRDVAEREMTEIISESSRIDQKKAASHMRQTGFRHATMRDLIDVGEVNQHDTWVAESVSSIAKSLQSKNKSRDAADKMKVTTDENIEKVAWNQFLDSKADDNIFIDKAGNLADFRDFRNTFEGVVNSLATEFTIPLVKINPLRMFYVDQFFTGKNKPMFHLSFEDQKNPFITGHNGSQGTKHLYMNGKVFSIDETAQNTFEEVGKDFFLAPAQTGPIARLARNMSRISISEFNKPDAYAPMTDRIRYNVQTTMDIGIQDEPSGQFDLLDPTSWVTSLINMGTGKLRMDEYHKRPGDLREAFGKNADFIYMRRHRSLEDSDGYKHYLSQFWSGRDNLDNVTLSTMFPYGYFERLNATLNQINLGLSNEALGDAPSVFGNLLLKRIAPVWAGMELWDYVNYESENLLGTQIEDQFAVTYANSSIEAAKIRDNLGITDWAKGITPLLVGGEQIADIPILGDMIDWNDTAEETEEFWREGEVAVRKGRWWPLGNTPYTGSNIDYFQPNWVRRTLSDYEFSDSLYGSREEYFQNSWMPTLSHPLAPIRHFITDPYHYERENYDSRPYMMTGGIPELENFPLIGPVLNATIGQILKPQIAMHTDEWSTPQYAQPVDNAMLVASGDTSSMMPLMGGIEGVGAGVSNGYSGAIQPAIHVGYTTASGATTVMETDDKSHIYDLLPNLPIQTPVATGDFKVSRIGAPTAVVEEGETPLTVGSAYSMLGNLHYNMGEMGGFYGFMAFSMTGEIADTRPIIQSSSDMTGYTRQFWDNDIGGFGGDANEIFRRFLPADRKLNEINTIENTMPSWLPGSNYFIDFQHGDPYTKVKKGEMRLPGEGYERLYGIDSEDLMKMDIGASFIGYDEQRIYDHMLKNDAIKDEVLNNILDKGTDWHVDWEHEMVDKNIAISTEQYVKDEAAGIGGFYDVLADHGKAIDWLMDNAVEFTYYQPTYAEPMPGAKVHAELGGHYYEGDQLDLSNEEEKAMYKNWAVSQSDTALIDPKTRSQRRFDEDEIHYENMQQVNFYGQQVGTPINYLIHVNRDNPDDGIKVFAFGTSDSLLQESYDKVQGVRDDITTKIENGDLHRGNLYEMIDRYRMLADVAPYSQEFRDMKSQLKNMNLSESEMDEARIINEQVSARKEKIRMYDYRFKNSEVETDYLTVDHIIDNNTFLAKEFPDNPISLAGVTVSTAQDSEEAAAAQGIIAKALREGGEVRVLLDADEGQRVKDNTYQTIDAVIFDKHGRNVNKLLIDEGLAKEKENDYSPTSVHARFSQNEIAFGSMWESFAHMDTMLHTKLLQVRSPIESYERREVYGKDWQEWTDPVDDFLIPFIQNSAMHNPLWSIGVGATVGAMFGSLKATDVDNEIVTGRYGKIVGAAVGATVMGAAWLNARVHEMATGERWIPQRRQDERDVEEYFDVLEYIKNNALYNKYAEMAMRDEGFDVKEYLRENEKEGEFRQRKRKDLEELKRRLYRSTGKEYQDVVREIEKAMDQKISDGEDPMKIINAEIERLSTQREIQHLPSKAAKAMLYKQEAEKTMYGYDSGDPVSNILAALPKKDRDYLMPFIESPVAERERILATVPSYMKRVLQSAWGMEVDEKQSLFEYFKDKPLPGAGWVGWKEDVTMKDMKVKFVDNVGLDPSEFDIWDADKQRADKIKGQAPNVLGNAHTDPDEYARKLKEILLGFNVQGVEVNVVQSNVSGININMDIDQNRRDDVQAIINQEGYRLF